MSALFLYRLLKKNPVVSVVKYGGLFFGILLFLVTLLLYRHHSDFDRWHSKSDKIYKFSFQSKGGEYMGSDKYSVTSAMLIPSVLEEIPQVIQGARQLSWGETFIKCDQGNILEDEVHAVDPSWFTMFDHIIIRGSSESMNEPYSAALSESAALRLFGTLDVIGKTLQPTTFTEMSQYTVRMVFRDWRAQSIYQPNVVFKFDDFLRDSNPSSLEQWGNRSYYSYIIVTDHNAISHIEKQATAIRNRSLEEGNSGEGFSYFLQPLTELHFSEGINFEPSETVKRRNIDILLTIGIILLMVSSINMINLSVSEAFGRAKEIGVRKTIGASKSSLFLRYLSESAVQTFLIFIITLLSLYFLIPVLNQYLKVRLTFFSNTEDFLLLLGIMSGITLLSSAYPAAFLSRLKPQQILKSGKSIGKKTFSFRKVLVVIQFAVSGILMVISIGINQQLSFILDKDPGFNREGILTISINDKKFRSDEGLRNDLKNRVMALAGVEAVSYSSQLPNDITSQNGRQWIDDQGNKRQVSLYTLLVDPDFLEVYGIELKEGRTFAKGNGVNRGKYLINEAAIKEIGNSELVGTRFIENNRDTIEIIGVMKNFHGLDLRQPIRPTRISVQDNFWLNYMSVKFNGDFRETDNAIGEIYASYTEYPYISSLFSDKYRMAYEEDVRSRSTVFFFTFSVIVISCLGLFGLLLNTFEQRKKEVGVRKVLGGSLQNIGWKLSHMYLLPILIAWMAGTPIAAYFLDQWLAEFAYRAEVGWFTYLFSLASLAFSLALSLTYILGKIYNLEPVNILRSE